MIPKIIKKVGTCLIVLNLTIGLANAISQPLPIYIEGDLVPNHAQSTNAEKDLLLPQPLLGDDNGDLLTGKCHALRKHLFLAPAIPPEASAAGSKKYWVLSLDGGGIRGIMQLQALAKLVAETNKPITQLVDAVAGTSVGGFIATLLTLPDPKNPSMPKYSPQGLLDEILANRSKVFQSKWQSFGGVFRTKYKTTSIKNYLQSLMGENNFKNRLLPTVLVTHDLHTYHQRLFSTDDAEDFDAWSVALGSGAPPTYFKPQDIYPKRADGTYAANGYYVSDGGTCMNNPALAGIALVREHYQTSNTQVPLENIHILSLGTGTENIKENAALRRGGALSWIKELAGLCINGQESADEYVVKNYFGAQYHRFNPDLSAPIKLDDISEESKDILLTACNKMLEDTERDNFNAVVKLLKHRTPSTNLPTSSYKMIPAPRTFFQRACDWFNR